MQNIEHVFQLLIFLFITKQFGWLMDTDYSSYSGNYQTTKAVNDGNYFDSSSEDYEETLNRDDKEQSTEYTYALNHPIESVTELSYTTNHSLNKYIDGATPYAINGRSLSWINNGNALLQSNDTHPTSTLQSLNRNMTKILIYDSTTAESTHQSSTIYSLKGNITKQSLYSSATYSTMGNNSQNNDFISSTQSSDVSIQTLSVAEKFKNDNNGYSTTINSNHFSKGNIQNLSNYRTDNLSNMELVNTSNIHNQNYEPQLIRKSFNTSYISGDPENNNTAVANESAVIVLPNATEGEDIIPLSSLTDTLYLLDNQPLNDTETSESFIMNTYSESALESEDLVASANNYDSRNMLENSTYIGYDNISHTVKMERLSITTNVPILGTNHLQKIDANQSYENSTDFNVTQSMKKNQNNRNDVNIHLNFSFEPKQFLSESRPSVEVGENKNGPENFTTQTVLKVLNKSDVYTTKTFELSWAPVTNISSRDYLSDTEIKMEIIPTEKSNYPILTAETIEAQNSGLQEKLQHRSIEEQNISSINLSDILKTESIQSNASNRISFNTTKLLPDSSDHLHQVTIKPSLLLNVTESINESNLPWVDAPFFNDFRPVRINTSIQFPSKTNVSTASTIILPTLLSSSNLSSEVGNINLSSIIANNSLISNGTQSLPDFKGITMFKLGIEDARPLNGINLSQGLSNQSYSDKQNDSSELKIGYNLTKLLPSTTFGITNEERDHVTFYGNPTYFPTVNLLPNSDPFMSTNTSQSYMLSAFSMDSPRNISYTNNTNNYTNFQEEKVIQNHFNKNIVTEPLTVPLPNHRNGTSDQWQNNTTNTPLLSTNFGIPFGVSTLNFKDNSSEDNLSSNNRSLLKENKLMSSEANETLVIKMSSKSNEHLQILAPSIFNDSESLFQPNINKYYVTITPVDTTNNSFTKQEIYLPITERIANVSYIESHLNVNNSDFQPLVLGNNYSIHINDSGSKQTENFNSMSTNTTASTIFYINSQNNTFFDFKAKGSNVYEGNDNSNMSDIKQSLDKDNVPKELPMLPTPISLDHTTIQQNTSKSVRKRSANVIKGLMTFLSNKSNTKDQDYSTTTTKYRLYTRISLDNSMEKSDIIDKISNLRNRIIVSKPCGVKGKGSLNSRLNRKDAINITDVGEMCWHAVLLRNPDLSYFCGGVVIGGKWILTTANCVIRLKPQDFIVRLGEWNLQDKNELPGSRDYNISFISIHPEFNASTLENDLALIKLPDFPDLSLSSICEICLPGDSWRHHNYGTKKCYVTGFGMDSENGKYSNTMKLTSTSIIDQSSCRAKLNGVLPKDEMTILCGTNGNIYFGDGGSPLICENGDHSILAGVVSWTSLQSVTGFTKISNYLPWIHETMKF